MKKNGQAALDAIVDVVLAYRRPRKAKPTKRKAKKRTKQRKSAKPPG